MIFKSDLIEAINDLSCEIASLAIRVSDLENKFEKRTAERRGRPLGSKDKTKRKSKNTEQPRTKDGKFAKKK